MVVVLHVEVVAQAVVPNLQPVQPRVLLDADRVGRQVLAPTHVPPDIATVRVELPVRLMDQEAEALPEIDPKASVAERRDGACGEAPIFCRHYRTIGRVHVRDVGEHGHRTLLCDRPHVEEPVENEAALARVPGEVPRHPSSIVVDDVGRIVDVRGSSVRGAEDHEIGTGVLVRDARRYDTNGTNELPIFEHGNLRSCVEKQCGLVPETEIQGTLLSGYFSYI